MIGSPIYEFPYSGYKTPSTPFFNYGTDVLSPYNISSLDSLSYGRPSTFTVPHTQPIVADLGNSTVVYQVPNNMSLDTLLRQLGVDVNSLQPSFPRNNYYANQSLPIDLILPRSPHHHRSRRRMVCHEVSDSDDDSDYRRSSHRRHHSSSNQSPARVHHLINNAWNRAANVSPDLSRSTSMPNMNPQWQAMQNMPPPPPPPMSTDQQVAVRNVWNQATNATKDKPNAFSSFFKRMRGGNTAQSSGGPQQNYEALQNFNAARNIPSGANQFNPAVRNVFNATQRGFAPPQNPPWNQMQSPPPAMNSAWNQMSRASQPPPQQPYSSSGPPPAINSAWNQLSRAGPPPQQPYYPPGPPPPPQQPYYPSGPSPAANTVWNQLSRASPPPPQQSYSSGSPMNSMWNQMQQGQYPSQNPSYSSPPMRGTQQGYPPSAAPGSFASMLAASRT